MQRRRALLERLEDRALLTALPYGAYPDDTGEYMLGDVRVTVVLMESDPAIPGADVGFPIENWTSAQIAEVKANVQAGVQWWKDTLDALPNVRDGLLNFTFDWTHADNPIHTGYEPIARASGHVGLWIYDFLNQTGFSSSGNFSTDIHAFNNFQRQQSNADWAFTVFVVNDANDADGKFADSMLAFSHVGGQFMVVPSSRPASTYAHEAAHQFWGLDEYSGPNNSYLEQRGYYNTQNTNAFNNPGDPPGTFSQQVSIMVANGPALNQAYTSHTTSTSSKEMIGWRDSDSDGIFDVLDVPFTLTGSGRYDAAASRYRFVGSTKVNTLPNQNSEGLQNDITINRIRQVEYSVDGGGWNVYPLTIADRTYSMPLDLSIPLTAGNHTIKIRTVDTRTGAMSPEFVGTTTVPSSTPSPGASGFVYRDDNSSGTFDANEPGLADWGVNLVDQFGAPIQLQRKIEPNDYVENAPLNTVVAQATLTAVGGDVASNQVYARSSTRFASAGKVFANSSILTGVKEETWTQSSRTLRVDFSTPVTSVSLRALSAGEAGVTSFGRLVAYDAAGNIVAQYTTGALTAGKSELMTILRPTAEISHVIAHAHMQSKVLLDSLTWGPAVGGTTNALGAWSLSGLPAGTYYVQVTAPPGYTITTPSGGIATVNYSSGQVAGDLNFGIRTGGPLWQNAALAANVTGDLQNTVNAQDLLAIINWMSNHPGNPNVPTTGNPMTMGGYVDPDGNSLCNPQDLLAVINYMASHPVGGTGEAESAAVPAGSGAGSSGSEGESIASATPRNAAEYYAQQPIHILDIPGTTLPCCCATCLAVDHVETILPATAASAAATKTDDGLKAVVATSAAVGVTTHASATSDKVLAKNSLTARRNRFQTEAEAPKTSSQQSSREGQADRRSRCRAVGGCQVPARRSPRQQPLSQIPSSKMANKATLTRRASEEAPSRYVVSSLARRVSVSRRLELHALPAVQGQVAVIDFQR